MSNSQAIQEIQEEMVRALAARKEGNEGMARVCARRAVGWAIRLRFRDLMDESATNNAFLLLEWFARQESVAEPYRQAAERLTTRINEDHELPHKEDPLLDADRLIRALLGMPEGGEAVEQ